MVGVRMMSLMLMMFSCLKRSRILISRSVRWQYVWCSNGLIFFMATRALLSRLYAELKQRDSKKQSDQTAFFLGYKTLSCSFVIIIHYQNIKENHTNNIKCIPSDTKIKSTRYKKFNTMWMQIGLSIMGTFLWTFRKAALKHSHIEIYNTEDWHSSWDYKERLLKGTGENGL